MSRGSPVIYIPGILGSQLYLPEDGKKLWFSAPAVLTDAKRLDIQSELSVKNNGVNLQNVSLLEKEYGVLKQDVFLVEWVCRTMPDSPVYFFSYDFRKSCRDNAEHLNKQIEELVSEGHSLINIVCHSMGGLVTSAYAAKYGTDRLGKVVMLGVPFEGSYEIINTYMTGDIIMVPNAVADTVGITRDILRGFQSLAELMPSVRHLEASPLVKFGVPMSVGDMEDFLCSLAPDTYADGRVFQSYVRKGYSLLLEKEDCFFGLGTKKSTLQSVGLSDKPGQMIKSESNKGDGLVTCFSSTMGGEILKLPYLRVKVFPLHHASLLRHPDALKWIGQCLRGDVLDLV